MSLILRTLSTSGAPLTRPDGTAIASAAVIFTLVDALKKQPVSLFDAVTGEYVVSEAKTATTNSTGEFSVDLWPNGRGEFATLYKVTIPSERIYPFYVSISDTVGTITLVQARTAVEAVTPQALSLFETLLGQVLTLVGQATAPATTTANGLMTSTDKVKLDGIAVGANNYTHPSTHPPAIIQQDSSNRFVTDTEKSTWNGKESAIVAGTTAQYWRGDKSWQTLNASAVGLGNVTNESKSTMFTNPTFTGTVSGITASAVGLGNVTNESKSTMFASPTFTGSATAADLTVTKGATDQNTTLNVTSIKPTRSAMVYVSAGDGTTSSKFAALRIENLDTNGQKYAVGTYGSDDFQIYDTKAGASRLSIAPSGTITFGGVAALIGASTAATAAVNTNTSQIATTAFVLGQAATSVSPMNGSAAVGASTTFARQDHVHASDTTRAPLASPLFTGNVGIGVGATARRNLEVKTSTDALAGVLVAGNSNQAGSLTLARDLAGAITTNSSIGFVSAGSTFDASGTLGTGGELRFQADGGWSTTSYPTRVTISTVASGSTSLTERVRVDAAGNAGFGVTPNAWNSAHRALEIGTWGALDTDATNFVMNRNGYYNASGQWIYKNTGTIQHLAMDGSGNLAFSTAASGTAGATATLAQKLSVAVDGLVTVNRAAATGIGAFVTANANIADISLAAGDSAANGRCTLFGWRYNGGSPVGFVETYGGAAPLALQSGAGRVLVGTISDNGVDRFQVNGSVSATALTSSIATGTAPLVITSTTKVNNLNVDMVDSFHASQTGAASSLVTTDSSANLKLATGNLFVGPAADNGLAKIQTSNGVTLGNTANANATVLDWYEEGTWTPVVQFGGAAVGLTGTFTGTFTRIGRMVTVDCSVVITALGSSTGNCTIGGLPFTAASNSTGAFDPVTALAGLTGPVVAGVSSGGPVYLLMASSTTRVPLTNANFTSTSQFRFSITYTV